MFLPLYNLENLLMASCNCLNWKGQSWSFKGVHNQILTSSLRLPVWGGRRTESIKWCTFFLLRPFSFAQVLQFGQPVQWFEPFLIWPCSPIYVGLCWKRGGCFSSLSDCFFAVRCYVKDDMSAGIHRCRHIITGPAILPLMHVGGEKKTKKNNPLCLQVKLDDCLCVCSSIRTYQSHDCVVQKASSLC